MKALKDLGENYEYMRVIAKNKIELKKLDLIEDTSNVLSYIILAAIASSLLTLIVISLSIAFILWLTTIVESLLMATLIFSAVILILLIVLMIFKKPLIINPIINKYYSLIKDRI